jgi:hypothetical protein
MRAKSGQNPLFILTPAAWKVVKDLRARRDGEYPIRVIERQEIMSMFSSRQTGERVIAQLIRIGMLHPAKSVHTGKWGHPRTRYRYTAYPERKWWKVARKHWETVEVPRHVERVIRTYGAPRVREELALEYVFKGRTQIFRKGVLPQLARERGTSVRDIRKALDSEIAGTLSYLAHLDQVSSNLFGHGYIWVVGREPFRAPSDLDMYWWADPREREGFYATGKMSPARYHPQRVRRRGESWEANSPPALPGSRRARRRSYEGAVLFLHEFG